MCVCGGVNAVLAVLYGRDFVHLVKSLIIIFN